jgi:hypothetical protein
VHLLRSRKRGLIFEVRDPTAGDSGACDKRRLIIEPEFAQILKVLAREGNTLSPAVRMRGMASRCRRSPTSCFAPHPLRGHAVIDPHAEFLTEPARIDEPEHGRSSADEIAAVQESASVPGRASLTTGAVPPPRPRRSLDCLAGRSRSNLIRPLCP